MEFWTHDACLLHDTGPGHPERPERLLAVTEALREAFPDVPWFEAPRATRGQLLRVHDASLLATVLETHSSNRVHVDADTVLSPASAEAALRAAGAAVAATAPRGPAPRRVVPRPPAPRFRPGPPPGPPPPRRGGVGFPLFRN